MLDDIIAAAAKSIPVVEGDYQKDGLWYCGKCHTRKQTKKVFDLNGIKKIVYPMVLCDCAVAERDRLYQQRLEQEWKDKMARLQNNGFPDRAMIEWTFENDDGGNEKLTKVCRSYVENFDKARLDGKGLLFYGSVGTGKTYMAACIANALIAKGIPCLVTNFARITNELQANFNNRQDYFDKLNQFELLVIDDLAAERDTEYMGEIVMNVIDSRYRAKKPLIVTTNLTGQQFRNPSDIRRGRVFSRLFEMCLPVEVNGADRRRKKLADDMKNYSFLFE